MADVANANSPCNLVAIDIARYELRKVVKSLPEGALFDIIGMYGRLAMLSEKWVVA